MQRAISRMAFEIIERNKGVEDVCIVGILRRGAVIADMIAQKISQVENIQVDVGYLDINNFRDDREKTGEDKSRIDFSIHRKKVILVDDVIFTGRSVRAAIDALLSRGRPDSIQLAALIDRGHRQLPIRPDYVGKNVPTSLSETVKVLVQTYDGQNGVSIYEFDEETQ